MKSRLTNKLHSPIPEKLKEARLARGYSMPQLANILGNTKQAISKYELGLSVPSPSVIGQIADVLNFPINFFFHTTNQPSSNGIVFFRSLKSAERKSRDMIAVRADWMERIFLYLQQFLDFTDINLDVGIPNKEIYDLDEIEELANSVRKIWGLGLGPISNVVSLLENQGIIISKMDIGESKIDACSQWRSQRPFVFLASDKQSAVRSRFDAAHELGHILLHTWVDEEHLLDKNTFNRIEKEANRFASSFLLPRDTFGAEIMSTSLDHFINLKKRWKVSLAAMIYRCNDLGLFTESQSLYLWKQMARLKYKTREPLDDVLPDEDPSVFKEAIQLLIEHNVQTSADILDTVRLAPIDIEMLCNLNPGSLNFEKKSRVELRVINTLKEM